MKPIQSQKALVVALGNPLTAEDSFGPRVLQKIRDIAAAADIHLLDAHTDLLGHIDRFASYPLVIIVDALLDSAGNLARAGQVITVDEAKLLSFPDDAPSIHQISPVVALKLFRGLYPGAATRFMLVALCAHEIQVSGTLKEDIITEAAHNVLRLLE